MCNPPPTPVNPISTSWIDYAHCIITCPLRFSDLQTDLQEYIVVASEARASFLSFLSKCSAVVAATVVRKAGSSCVAVLYQDP